MTTEMMMSTARRQASARYWAPRINAEWRKSVESVVNVGRELIAAKQACEHGEFLRLFKGNESAVSKPVPFGERTAEMLMAIAGNAVLSNPKHASVLPQSWYTLYELTRMDDEQLVAGIKAGEITPETTRAGALALRADPIARIETAVHEVMADAVKNAVTKFAGQLTTHEQFHYVRERLASLLDFLAHLEAEMKATRGDA
jgi:hypothetical protein